MAVCEVNLTVELVLLNHIIAKINLFYSFLNIHILNDKHSLCQRYLLNCTVFPDILKNEIYIYCKCVHVCMYRSQF